MTNTQPCPERMPSADEMREAVAAMFVHRSAAARVNRSGWTDQQWIEDARQLMDDVDGSVSSLLNGHVLALFRAVPVARDE